MSLGLIGFIIVLAIFGYELYKAVHERNWGSFNKTSVIVWSAVGILALIAVLLVVNMTRA